MNRATLLRAIKEDLQSDLKNAAAPALLAESVRRFADRLEDSAVETIHSASLHASGSQAPVPMEAVAAYVDGTLSDEESSQLTQRLYWDRELLAEVIAGVRAACLHHNPIPSSLQDRLFALRDPAAMQPPTATIDSQQTNDPQPSTLFPHVVQVRPRASQRTGKAVASVVDRVGWLIAAGLAAALLLLLGWRFAHTAKTTLTPTDMQIAQDSSPSDQPRPMPVELDDASPDQLAVSPKGDEPMVPTRPGDPTTVDPADIAMQPTDHLSNPSTVPSPPSLTPAQPQASNQRPQLAQTLRLEWTNISGILAVRRSDGNADSSITTSSSASRANPWASIDEQASMTVAATPSDTQQSPLTLRTLPMTRAEASLTFDATSEPNDANARHSKTHSMLVLSADSELVFQPDGALDVRYGSIAITGLPAAAAIHFARNTRPAVRATWSVTVVEEGSLLVERQMDGVRLSVHSGKFLIEGTQVQQATVLLPHDDDTPMTTATTDAGRLPGWVQRPVDRIEVPQAFLAQLRTTTDLPATLGAQIRQLESGNRLPRGAAMSLATLCRWQAALHDDQLFRLVGVNSPTVRLAALQRLASVLPQDPRHAVIWSSLRRSVRDQRALETIRATFVHLWQRKRPSDVQINQLVTLLESNSLASRATVDFLLRQIYSGGPTFDPTWTGTTLQRGTRSWQSWIAQRR